jgi:hypothetical protein
MTDDPHIEDPDPQPRVGEARAGSGGFLPIDIPATRGRSGKRSNPSAGRVPDLLCRDGKQEGAPRPQVGVGTAALRAYNPTAREISTRQGLLGGPPGVRGRTTKTVYTRAREGRGDERPATDSAKATLRGVTKTG